MDGLFQNFLNTNKLSHKKSADVKNKTEKNEFSHKHLFHDGNNCFQKDFIINLH